MSQQIESVKMALQELGINASGEFYYNPDYDLLIAHETSPELTGAARGVMTDSGAVAVDTGIFTGRSPRDKYIVRDEQTRDTVWWADSGLGRNDNKPLSPDVWRSLKSLVAGQLSGKKLYVIDAWCGASPDTRLGVAAAFEVKHAVIVPAVLIIADQLTMRIGRQGGFPGTGEAEEQRHVPCFATVGRAVHRRDAFLRQQVVHDREQPFLHFAAVPGTADELNTLAEIKGDEVLGVHPLRLPVGIGAARATGRRRG